MTENAKLHRLPKDWHQTGHTLLGNLTMTENATFLSFWAVENQAGNPIGSALVLVNVNMTTSQSPEGKTGT